MVPSEEREEKRGGREDWARWWRMVKGRLRSLGLEGAIFLLLLTPPDPLSIGVHSAPSWETYLHGWWSLKLPSGFRQWGASAGGGGRREQWECSPASFSAIMAPARDSPDPGTCCLHLIFQASEYCCHPPGPAWLSAPSCVRPTPRHTSEIALLSNPPHKNPWCPQPLV